MVTLDLVIGYVGSSTLWPHERIFVTGCLPVPPAHSDVVPHVPILVLEAGARLQRYFLTLQDRFYCLELPCTTTARLSEKLFTQIAFAILILQNFCDFMFIPASMNDSQIAKIQPEWQGLEPANDILVISRGVLVGIEEGLMLSCILPKNAAGGEAPPV